MTVRGKNRGFVEASREARCRANLSILLSQLGRLVQQDSSPLQKSRQYDALRRLDQGLSDLVRIGRGPSGSELKRSPRARRRGVDPVVEDSTSKG